MSKRLPKIGEPDFSGVSDERLNDYKNTIQQMLHSYKDCTNSAEYSLLHKIWKDLCIISVDRLNEEVEEKPLKKSEPKEEVKIHKIKRVKRLGVVK